MTAEEESRIDWSLTTWKGSRLQQHREFLALPFRRKLEVIEELDDFARYTQEYLESRGRPYIDPATGELVKGHIPGAMATGASLRRYFREGGSGVSEQYLDDVEAVEKNDPPPNDPPA